MLAQVALRDGLVEVLRPGAAEHARGQQLGAGHHRRALGDVVADLPELLDLRVGGLAEVVPDRRGARDDVRLIAAVGDHVVRALLERQVLAAEVPADVHQLDRVERAAAAPRAPRRRARSRRGTSTAPTRGRCRRGRPTTRRGRSSTCVNSATSTSLKSPARTKYALVPTSSSAVPGQIRIVPGSFSRSMIFFTAMRRGDVDRLPGVVPLAVARRALDHRIVSRRRRASATPAECRRCPSRARAPACPIPSVAMNAVGMPAIAFLHGEAVLLEDVDQVAVGLDFLEAELAEAEDLVDHLLREASACRRRRRPPPSSASACGRRRRRGGRAAAPRRGRVARSWASGAAVSTAVTSRAH